MVSKCNRVFETTGSVYGWEFKRSRNKKRLVRNAICRLSVKS